MKKLFLFTLLFISLKSSFSQNVVLNYPVLYVRPACSSDTTVKGILFNPTTIQIEIGGNRATYQKPDSTYSEMIDVKTTLIEQLRDGSGFNQQVRVQRFDVSLLSILRLNTSTLKMEADPTALNQILSSFGLKLN